MLVLNGNPVSGASATIRVDGTIIQSITAINCKQSLEGVWIRAVGSSIPIAQTDGDYSAEGDFELLAQEAQNLRAALAAKHPRGEYGKQKFDILVQCDNGIDVIHEIKMVGCRISSDEIAIPAGNAEIKVKMPLSVHWLELDGVRMARPSEAFEGLLAA